MDRKEFFKYSFNLLTSRFTPEEKERPPGATPDFLSLCTGCDACMAACPVNVIMIEDLEKRHPVIYPKKDPCIHCPGYPCIASCPTGALTPTLSLSSKGKRGRRESCGSL